MTKSNKTKNSPSLPYFDDYLLMLQTNNYSDKTIYNYERDLKVFEDYLKDNHLKFKNLKRKDIEQYKAYLTSIDRQTAEHDQGQKKLGSYSINRMLSSLRSYLKYIIDNEYHSPISPEMVKLTKTEKKHPRVAELEDLIKLIKAPTNFEKNKKVARRNRAMLEVMFSTGLRISELVNLNRDQIDKTGKIFVMGKGKKERFVYLTPRAQDHLNKYLDIRTDDSPALFIPYRGQRASKHEKRISINYLQDKIKHYRERLKINVPTSAHSLRHGFATYLAEQGANPAAIQILLGHESLDTTTRYVHASDRYAEKTMKKFHPLKNK
ncbi:MAG: tyrosine-type recombinase/integrase [Patescibacteria group bacterium]|nr:tyrosine-type recombinase/integrase [Patescibacteria group bacterium]